MGDDACPNGYTPIKNLTECGAAANELGYAWNEHGGKKDNNSVCNYCTACSNPSSKRVQLSSNHGRSAFWVCKKGK